MKKKKGKFTINLKNKRYTEAKALLKNERYTYAKALKQQRKQASWYKDYLKLVRANGTKLN